MLKEKANEVDDISKSFDTKCSYCGGVVAINKENNHFVVECNDCDVLYYSGELKKGDIYFDGVCILCGEFGVKYQIDRERVICVNCGEVLFE